VILATGAAALFGLGLFATGRVADEVPVIWALVPARLVIVLAIALPLAVRRRLIVVRRAAPMIVAAGIAEVVGFGSYAVGARDSVAVAAVLSSQFAAVALIAGWFLFRERLSRVQLAGVALVIAGVAAVVVATA
jgi:drug/metabolite transporter (DMT)-like permease